jgi:hypothetical protein
VNAAGPPPMTRARAVIWPRPSRQAGSGSLGVYPQNLAKPRYPRAEVVRAGKEHSDDHGGYRCLRVLGATSGAHQAVI